MTNEPYNDVLTLKHHSAPFFEDDDGALVGSYTATLRAGGDGLDLTFVELINSMPDHMYDALMDALEATAR